MGIGKADVEGKNVIREFDSIDKINSDVPITTNVLEGMKVVEIIERIYEVRDKTWKK